MTRAFHRSSVIRHRPEPVATARLHEQLERRAESLMQRANSATLASFSALTSCQEKSTTPLRRFTGAPSGADEDGAHRDVGRADLCLRVIEHPRRRGRRASR